MPTLTTAQLLDFAAMHPDIRGEVDGLIRRELGVTPARYCQLLMRAAVSLEGQAHDPITAHREIRRMGWSAHILPTNRGTRAEPSAV